MPSNERLAKAVAEASLAQTVSQWPDCLVPWTHGVTFGIMLMTLEPDIAPLVRQQFEEWYAASRNQPPEHIEQIARHHIIAVMRTLREKLDG